METVVAVVTSLVEEERYQVRKLSLSCYVTSSATLELHLQEDPQHIGSFDLGLLCLQTMRYRFIFFSGNPLRGETN